MGELRPGVQQLKDGKYHDVEKVEQRVESLASRLHPLGSRLKTATSAVDEAQAVVAMETSLEELEVWLVTCGKFSNNQNIVSQIEEHKVCTCIVVHYSSLWTSCACTCTWACMCMYMHMYMRGVCHQLYPCFSHKTFFHHHLDIILNLHFYLEHMLLARLNQCVHYLC